jgi:hypothetical protein
MADLYEKFIYLPEKVRDWLSSDNLSFAIGEFNERLKLSLEKEGIIASLILRLTVRDIIPEDLANELKEGLEIDFNSAKNLALEIEEKLLRSKSGVLKELDVNIDLIKEGKEKPKAEKPVIKEEIPAFIKKEEALRPAQGEPAPLPISEIELPAAEKPFMISEEKLEIPVIPEAPKPTFIFKAEIPRPPSPPRPTTAKIERGNQ